MIKKVAAGIYTYMPAGWRSLSKLMAIVRREMDAAGAVELAVPAIQPAELWSESGRWQKYGKELLRLRDRHERDFCFGPTHEEVITDAVRRDVRSTASCRSTSTRSRPSSGTRSGRASA